MKKIILSIAMIATIAFVSCSDNNETSSCKSCKNIADSGADIEICDNGNGTATATMYLAGKVVSTTTQNIPEGESVENIDCSNLKGFDIVVNDIVIGG